MSEEFAIIEAEMKEAKALEKLEEEVKKGSTEARLALAVGYEMGSIGNIKMDKDEKKAFELYRKLAEEGVAVVQYKLSDLYEKGEIVEKDAKEARFWLKQAARNGDVDAQAKLLLAYVTGAGEKALGLPRNWVEANRLLRVNSALCRELTQAQLERIIAAKGRGLLKEQIVERREGGLGGQRS